MKRFIKIILIILIAAAGIYTYDIFSGYSISKYVDERVNFSSDEQHITSSEPSKQNELNRLLYFQLDDEGKKLYDTIYYGVSEHKNPIFIGFNKESDNVFDILKTVLCEHPELFWCSGSCSFSSNGYLTVKYSCSKEEAQLKSQKIDAKAEELLSTLGTSQQEKAVQLFDYVVETTEYDFENVSNLENNPEISTIEGVLLNGRAVCGGYAKAYQFLLQRAGMQAVYVTGAANSPKGEQHHGWVCQQIDGENYFSDPTWSDSFEGHSDSNFISHTYFCLSGDEISETHKADDKFSAIKASKGSYDFFTANGFYFDEYNVTDIRTALKSSIERNQAGAELKFSFDEVYRQAVEKLIDKEELYYILLSLDPLSVNISSTEVSYSSDDSHRVLTILYKKSM